MEIIERKHRLAPLAQIGCIEHLLERPVDLADGTSAKLPLGDDAPSVD